jgi:hypothetical protein
LNLNSPIAQGLQNGPLKPPKHLVWDVVPD